MICKYNNVGSGFLNAQLCFAHDRVGYNRTLVTMDYGETWRKQRKMLSQSLSPSVVSAYNSLQESEARKLVVNCLEKPEQLKDHIFL
jgi:cytochrome P450